MTHPPQHPPVSSVSGSALSLASTVAFPVSTGILRPRLIVPRFFGFFFKSSSEAVGAKERTETCTTVDSGGSGKLSEVMVVSSVRIRPKYKIRKKAALGGSSSDQSAGHVLHTISFISPIVILGSNSIARRRPETNKSVIETLGVDGTGAGSESLAGEASSCIEGGEGEGTISSVSCVVA